MNKQLPKLKPLFDSLENFDQHNQNTSHPYPADFQHAYAFLYSYRGSEATFNSYRRELERLLHWSSSIIKKPLTTLTRADIENYIEFCQNPPIHWIGTKNVPRFVLKEGQRIANPEWRPFVATITKKAHREGEKANIKKYNLSQKALQAIFSVLSSFFNYLIQEDAITVNPIAQIRQKSKFIRKHQAQTPIRRLSELQWAYVIETAEIMAGENPKQHERTLFIMTALFAMYLRISELGANKRWIPQMGHFYQDSDGNWWFKTVGKGNKERDISVSDAMLTALKRYRLSRHLITLPTPGETTPLIIKNYGKGPLRGTRHLRKIVQLCFDRAITRMQKDNFKEEAEQLMSATVHWLRHTGIS